MSKWWKPFTDNEALFEDMVPRPKAKRTLHPATWDRAKELEKKMEAQGYRPINDLYDNMTQGIHHFVCPNGKDMETVYYPGVKINAH